MSEFEADSVPTSSFDTDDSAPLGPMDPDPSLVCPECGATETRAGKSFSAASLGRHRRDVHEIVGKYRKPDAKPKSAKRSSSGRKASTIGTTSVLLEVVGAMWASVDPTCGVTFQEQISPLAKAIDVWAQQDPKVYEMIMGFGKTSGPLGVCIALMPVIQTAAVHHVGPLIARRRQAAEEATAGDVVDFVESFEYEPTPI